ncbi:MAG: hypothetical protein M3329_00050 [Pseudomonadota bacterium]|nr:hypothetical protein [Pseudomonadota bacterium]
MTCSTIPGQSAFKKDKRVADLGVTIGLAWTPLAGTRSAWSQAAIMNMRGFKLAGQLGEVMRGSAEIAYRYVIGNAAGFGIEKNFFEDAFVPLHAPARATPRDSSSAGITTANALLPLERGRRVARRVAMAGRVDAHRPRATRGRHREKVVAARRAGCKEPILPADNRGDFDALPKYIHEGVNTRQALYYRFVGGRTGTAAV